MRSVITVNPDFDACWPWSADHFHALWKAQGSVEFIRQHPGDATPVSKLVPNAATVTRLAVLGTAVTTECASAFTDLKEAAIDVSDGNAAIAEAIARAMCAATRTAAKDFGASRCRRWHWV